MSLPARVVIDQRLRQRVLMANVHHAERVAFLLGARHEDEAHISAVVLPPLDEASETHAVFDMRWFTILRTTCRRLELEPDVRMVGWMHSHPRMSIFLSSTDLPTAESFRRYDREVAAVVVNPYDETDPIGGFVGPDNERIPAEFRRLYTTPRELLERLAVLAEALPEFDDVIVPDWVEPPARLFREATASVNLRVLSSQRWVLSRVEAAERQLRELRTRAQELDLEGGRDARDLLAVAGSEEHAAAPAPEMTRLEKRLDVVENKLRTIAKGRGATSSGPSKSRRRKR